MKKVINLLIVLLFVVSSFAQQVSMESGKIVSKLSYAFPNGEIIDDIRPTTNYFMNVGYGYIIPNSLWTAFVNVSYKNLGAVASNELLNNYYEWSFDYLGLRAGMNYEFFKPYVMPYVWNGFTVGVKVACAYELPMVVTHNSNNLIYNLKETEPYNKSIFYINGGLSINYYFTKKLAFSISHDYFQALKAHELLYGHLVDNEEIKFTNRTFSLGINYNIKK